MKKILFAALLLSFLIGGQIQAAGLVPCGGPGENACSFCHIFVMLNNIVQFVIIKIVPAVAILMMAVGGIMFFFAGGSSSMLSQAKGIITATIIGLVIIFAAFMLVGTILSMIGLASWTQDFYRNWWQQGIFQIPGCPT
jgi:hypothetical protein